MFRFFQPESGCIVRLVRLRRNNYAWWCPSEFGDDYDSVYYRYYMDVRKRSLFCIEVVYGIECYFDCSIHYFKYKYLHGFNINV